MSRQQSRHWFPALDSDFNRDPLLEGEGATHGYRRTAPPPLEVHTQLTRLARRAHGGLGEDDGGDGLGGGEDDGIAAAREGNQWRWIGGSRMRGGPALEQYRDTRRQATARCTNLVRHGMNYSCPRCFNSALISQRCL